MPLTNNAKDAYPGNVVIMHMDRDHQETDSHPKGNVYEMVNEQLYTFPAGVPCEVPAFVADRVMEHKHFHGFVVVEAIRTQQGVRYDSEAAEEKALDILKEKDDDAVQQYVLDQMEDRVTKGFPALPPGKRLARIIRKRNISLAKRYNLHPINWEDDGVVGTGSAPGVAASPNPQDAAKVNELEKQVKGLQSQIASTEDKLNSILTLLQNAQQSAAAQTPADATPEPEPSADVEPPTPAPAEVKVGGSGVRKPTAIRSGH